MRATLVDFTGISQTIFMSRIANGRRQYCQSTAEWKGYGRDTNDSQNPKACYHGLVFICPLHCEKQTNICTGYGLGGDWSHLELRVNGLAAHAQTEFVSEDCVLPSHNTTGSDELPLAFIFPPQEDGTWELKVRIKPLSSGEEDDIKIFQINSIVII